MFLLCGAALSALAVHAQKKVIIEDESPKGVVLVTIDKAGDEIIRIMNESQMPYIHEPQAPRFLLTDRKGKFALGIGGYVRATAEYDFGGIVDNIDFIPAYIPNGSKIRNQFQMDASTSTIFLKLVGHTKILGDFVVYTAGNFRNGSNKGFQLRNAYVSFRDVTVGYTYGGFMDLGAMPSTIDFQGPNGATFYRATQVSYTYKGLKNFRFNASVEVPAVDGTTNNELDIAQQRMPDFTAYAQYGWNSKSHVRVGGLIRSMTYTSTLSDKAHAVTGFGIQASTTFNLGKQWQVFGQATYGKGIGQYLNDLSNLNVDIVPNPDEAGKMQALPDAGLVCRTAIQHQSESVPFKHIQHVTPLFRKRVSCQRTVHLPLWTIFRSKPVLECHPKHAGRCGVSARLAYELRQFHQPCQPHEPAGAIFLLKPARKSVKGKK